MEKLLASSYMYGYLCLYLIFISFYILLASSYIYTSSYMFVCFVFARLGRDKLIFCLVGIRQK